MANFKNSFSKNSFDITDWCDYVRGVADPERMEAMVSMAEAGEAPSRLIDTLSLVAEVGQLDSTLEVPEHAVRVAKAAGSLRRPTSVVEAEPGFFSPSRLLRFLPFSITFDSLTQPAAAGTRNLQVADRQLSVEAEGFKVDLRLEHDTEPNSTVVVGQLLHRDREQGIVSTSPISDVPVLAVEEGRIVGRSLTGRFGEFQAEGLPNKLSSLCLLVGPDECIELPIGAG